ncbi:efflux RND transporter periplasmic adaptor subunit [Thioalkalivibrio sp. HK1]|uniref:efflux RND transporter periplasmic adaptor subunit n=1 Tax=Thioalkalivibrio sp. HK1 TaxID=1469245 RepID=UPI0004712ADE|nr:efflux RND transporter periplasmic adaptor subunit [Thioalkalivibrio sp. HK1]
MPLPPSEHIHPNRAALVFSIALSFLCALTPSTSEAQGSRSIPVVLAVAERRVLAPVAWYPATVISRNQAQISAEATGRIEHIVDVGTVVEPEEEVARIDDTLLRKQLIEEETAIAREQARVNYLDAEVRRLERLLADNIETRSRLDKAISDREIGRSDLRAARARLDTTLEHLARHRIRAPFAGTITERLQHRGEWALSGQAMMHIVDTESLEVRTHAPLSALDFVRKNDRLQVKASSLDIPSRVRAIVPVAREDRSGIYEIRLSIEPPDLDIGRLDIGQSVRVALPTSIAREVVAVPQDALIVRREGISVFRIGEDNAAERVMVTTGIAEGDLIEVDGVAAGDRVVIRGGERLKPGQTVEAIELGDRKRPPA